MYIAYLLPKGCFYARLPNLVNDNPFSSSFGKIPWSNAESPLSSITSNPSANPVTLTIKIQQNLPTPLHFYCCQLGLSHQPTYRAACFYSPPPYPFLFILFSSSFFFHTTAKMILSKCKSDTVILLLQTFPQDPNYF